MMLISAICRRSKPYRVAGFTLIELLVVITIMGLLTGVVIPKLYAMERSARYAAQRSALLREIGSLGYKAYINGRAITLSSSVTGAAPLDIPEGWRIVLPQAIQYDFNGICSGGTVILVAPDGAEDYLALPPPLCEPVQNG